MDFDKRWRESHEKWASDAHTNLLKLNAGRGLDTADPDDAKHVPLELRGMLPPAVSDPVTAPWPSDTYMAKAQLAELTGEATSIDETDYFQKFMHDLAETQRLTINRTVLPTNRSDDDGAPLRKAAVLDSQRKMFEDLKEFASAEETVLLEKALAASDLSCFAELAAKVIQRVKAEQVAA